MKFEEDLEERGEKWSKPHVASLSLHSLFDLRSCMLKGTVMLDLVANNLEEVSGRRQGREGGDREREGGIEREVLVRVCILVE